MRYTFIIIGLICSINTSLGIDKINKNDIKKLVKKISTTVQLYDNLQNENELLSRDSLSPKRTQLIKFSWNFEFGVGSWITEVKLPKRWGHFTVWKIEYSHVMDAAPKYIAVGYDGGIYYLSGFERKQFGNLARNQIKNVPDTNTAFEVALLYLETVEQVEFNSTLIRATKKNSSKDKLPKIISRNINGYIVQIYSENSRKESELYKVKVNMRGECELIGS